MECSKVEALIEKINTMINDQKDVLNVVLFMHRLL